MFEFSRGAYTVRSLTGMLSICGLATTLASSPPAEHWGEIDRLYDNVYRPARGQSAATAPYPRVPIRFLGVWDTVGSLGIPDTLGVLNLFDVENRHRFHNTRLNALIEHARHAVALDETRVRSRPPCGPGDPRRVISAACGRCGSRVTIATWGADTCRPGCLMQRCSG